MNKIDDEKFVAVTQQKMPDCLARQSAIKSFNILL